MIWVIKSSSPFFAKMKTIYVMISGVVADQL
jgi:hypothetical protein